MKQFLSRLIARHRLQKMVDAKRQSFEIQQYRKNRAAQIGRRSIVAGQPGKSACHSTMGV